MDGRSSMLLILGGTTEARELATHVARSGLSSVMTLAGATKHPEAQPIETVIGGFGGEVGFRRFVTQRGVRAIVDATHPFAHRITERTARLAAALGIAHLILQRPPWIAGAGDKWSEVPDPAACAGLVRPGQVVFLSTGRQTLDAFIGLSSCEVFCRLIDPPEIPFPFAFGRFIVGRPPFSISHEEALFRELRIDWLITKNAGGTSSASKLHAARRLGLPVAMIRRPPLPQAAAVKTVEEARRWVQANLSE